jgi:broad-specificity NMP kinase
VPSVVIITGPPGAGKSTVAARFAREHDKGVHLHTDDFWRYIVAGVIPPYQPESHQQNETVMDVIAAAADIYAAGGYLTVVDGIVGPWMLDHFCARVVPNPDVDLHYVVLRPQRDITLARARARNTPNALVEEAPIIQMWNEFANLGVLETHVLDTSHEDLAATSGRVSDAVNSGQMRLEC